MNFPNALPVKIILIGAGGTGGYILPHVYRIAYSLQRPIRIIVCDGDIVEQKNIVRQNFAPQDIGLNKAKALAERYSSAFGISCEYIPRFIESEDELLALTNPDCIEQKVVLIGAVDNNKSRQVCHRIFYRKPNLVYIDAGNGLYTGQVVCGLRKNGRTQSKPVGALYPDILSDQDSFPSELSCADRAASEPQAITANLMASNTVICMLYDLLCVGKLYTKSATFSSFYISTKADVIQQKRTA